MFVIFVSIFVIFYSRLVNLTKKSILTPKSSKNINVQKLCQNSFSAIIKVVISKFTFFKNPRIYQCNFDTENIFRHKNGLDSWTNIWLWSFFCRFLSFFGQIDEKPIDLNPEKFKKYQCPKMVSKRLYGHYLRSYEQF